MPERQTLTEVVTGNVRAELARAQCPTRAVAEAIGRSVAATNRRLSGKVALNVDELAAIADLLQIDVLSLFPAWDGGDDPEPPDVPAAAAAVA